MSVYITIGTQPSRSVPYQSVFEVFYMINDHYTLDCLFLSVQFYPHGLLIEISRTEDRHSWDLSLIRGSFDLMIHTISGNFTYVLLITLVLLAKRTVSIHKNIHYVPGVLEVPV